MKRKAENKTNKELIAELEEARRQLAESRDVETQLKKALDDATASRRRAEAIIDTIGDGISIQDKAFRVLYQNEAHKKLIGEHTSEFCYKAYQTREAVCEGCPVNMAFCDGDTHTAERVAITAQGKVFVETKATPIRDSAGEIIAAVEIARDISKRKQLESELRLSSEIVANIAEGLYLVRVSDGIIVFANPKFERMFGYGPDELPGKHVSAVNAPTEKPPEETAEEIIKALDEDGVWAGEILNIRKNGTTFWCSATVSTFEHHKYGRVWLSLHEDITDRKQAEKELTDSKKMLDDITQGITESIFLLSKDYKILWANKASAKQTGLRVNELIGNYCYKVTHKLDCICAPPNDPCPVHDLLNNGDTKGDDKPKSVEHIHYDRDGNTIFVEISAYPVKDNNGEVVRFVHMSKDITERKNFERALQEKTDQILRQNDELQESNAELKALYKIAKALGRTISIDNLLAELLRTLTGIKIFHFQQKGIIFFVDGEKMSVAAHTGIDQTLIESHKDIMTGDCLCGLAAQTGENIISHSSDVDTRHTIRDFNTADHGHIILPLKNADKVIGVLCLFVMPAFEIEERLVNLLSSIAKQIGLAIENARLYEETRALSLHDPLTGLANRRYMDIVFEVILAKTKRYGSLFSFIMLDIDHFKIYNDTYGHAAGDKLLIQIAGLLSGALREIDLVVRYGGEEFFILLDGADPKEAHETAERIRIMVEDKTDVTVSLGVASNSTGAPNKEEIIDKADKALYLAKQGGRNRVEQSE